MLAGSEIVASSNWKHKHCSRFSLLLILCIAKVYTLSFLFCCEISIHVCRAAESRALLDFYVLFAADSRMLAIYHVHVVHIHEMGA